MYMFPSQVFHKLKQKSPIMRYIMVGMQTAGKSKISERVVGFASNVVADGTGTRCPLDVTTIHDPRAEEPQCTLTGCSTCCGVSFDEGGDAGGGSGMTQQCIPVQEVFARVTKHNQVCLKDQFSSDALRLRVKAKNVENMQLVDLPGIKSTKEADGPDDRAFIKDILNAELQKENTHLVVLLQPHEYATNSIIDELDKFLGNRQTWMPRATFLMTKMDILMAGYDTAGRVNNFFTDFHKNGIWPYLVLSPIMKADPKTLSEPEQYAMRQKLLDDARDHEKSEFRKWEQKMEDFCHDNPGEPEFSPQIRANIGFDTAMNKLRTELLKDTAKKLPKLQGDLLDKLAKAEAAKSNLVARQQYADPNHLKLVISRIEQAVTKKIVNYLDGDLESAIHLEHLLQTLDQELDFEEGSDWKDKRLNTRVSSKDEEQWRNHIADMEDDFPSQLHPDVKLLGGKQYHRAFQFFCTVMIDRLPSPFALKDKVITSLGFLHDGMRSENWERATSQIIKTCMKDVMRPGTNHFIKHVGAILRRLFKVAMTHMKEGREDVSELVNLLPPHVERWLEEQYDELLWDLMTQASEYSHISLEPMYKTINPNIPTLVDRPKKSTNKRLRTTVSDGSQTTNDTTSSADSDEDVDKEAASTWSRWKERTIAMWSGSDSAKKFMKNETNEKLAHKQEFLAGSRASFITKEETEEIVQQSFRYITESINQVSRFCEWNPDWLLAGLSSREGFIVIVNGKNIECSRSKPSRSTAEGSSETHDKQGRFSITIFFEVHHGSHGVQPGDPFLRVRRPPVRGVQREAAGVADQALDGDGVRETGATGCGGGAGAERIG